MAIITLASYLVQNQNKQNENIHSLPKRWYILTYSGGVWSTLLHIQILLHYLASLVYSQRAIDGWTARMMCKHIDPPEWVIIVRSTTQRRIYILLCCDGLSRGTPAGTFLWAIISASTGRYIAFSPCSWHYHKLASSSSFDKSLLIPMGK